VQNQLDVINRGIGFDVRAGDLRRPEQGTTINDLLLNLDDFKHDWWAKSGQVASRKQPWGEYTEVKVAETRYDLIVGAP